ncbi:MAG: M48 family metalloprotease [Pseudomonadota bacterium]
MAAVLAALLTASASPTTFSQIAGNSPRSGSLPTLGDNLELTAGAERRIGERIATSIYRDRDYIDDAVLEDYVQTIWQPLMAAARARGELSAELDERFAWEIFLIRDRSINAFALPGGYFGLHLGLISAVSSRDELAAVMGHELSHVTQRHISRLMTQQSKQTPWMIAAMIIGALAASKSPQIGEAAMMGGQALAVQSQLNFSRDMEREADRVGFGVMADAGFDSRGVSSMFEKLQQASRINDNGSFPYLRSHPLTTERIAEAQSRLQLSPPSGGTSAADATQLRLVHAMMAARARVLADPGVDILRTLIAEAQRQDSAAPAVQPPLTADIRRAGALYAGALAAARFRDFALARNFAEKARALAIGTPAARTAQLLALEIEVMAGTASSLASGIDISKTVTRADLLIQAKALLAAGRAKDVSDKLQTWVTAHPRDALAWQTLAVAYGNQNQNVRAIRADAEARAAQLDYTAALDRFKAAQIMMRQSPGSADFMDGSIIDVRTRQMESLVREQALQDKLDR